MNVSAGRPEPRNWLFLATAILLAVVTFAGFAPSYWMPMVSGRLDLHPIMHVHGALFFLWALFLVLQSALIEANGVAAHRQLGLLGIALASAMLFSGVLAQILQVQLQLGGPRPEVVRNVTALGLSAMLMFAVFVGAAILNIRRPDLHRRLMVLASFAIIGAAVVRLMRFVPDTTQPQRGLLGAALVDLMLLIVIAVDRRATGRLHPVWVAGGGFLLANQIVRELLAQTPSWVEFTAWLATLGR
jgi:hypothetical protein